MQVELEAAKQYKQEESQVKLHVLLTEEANNVEFVHSGEHIKFKRA